MRFLSFFAIMLAAIALSFTTHASTDFDLEIYHSSLTTEDSNLIDVRTIPIKVNLTTSSITNPDLISNLSISLNDDDYSWLTKPDPIAIVDFNAYVTKLASDEVLKLNLGSSSNALIFFGDPLIIGSETTLYWPGISTNTYIKPTGNGFYQIYSGPKTTSTLLNQVFTIKFDSELFTPARPDLPAVNTPFDISEGSNNIPEPASASMLALAGIVILSKRRRKSNN